MSGGRSFHMEGSNRERVGLLMTLIADLTLDVIRQGLAEITVADMVSAHISSIYFIARQQVEASPEIAEFVKAQMVDYVTKLREKIEALPVPERKETVN